MFTAHDRAGDRPGNEATLRAFRARKQRWRAASFPFNDRCVFCRVCAELGVCVRATKAMKGSIFLTPLLCHFSKEIGEFLQISGPNAPSGRFLRFLMMQDSTVNICYNWRGSKQSSDCRVAHEMRQKLELLWSFAKWSVFSFCWTSILIEMLVPSATVNLECSKLSSSLITQTPSITVIFLPKAIRLQNYQHITR